MRKRYEVQGAETDPLEEFQIYESNKHRNSIHSISPVIGLVFIIFLCGLLQIIYIFDNILPTALKIIDEKNNPDAFIGERAQHDLKLLTDMGPRVTGSYENEALAVDYFKREISFIQQQAHPIQKIEVDIQTVSGLYFLDFKPHGCINAYGNVQNVIVKLHGRRQSEPSLLVNAHYDTVPTSPGGSDDGINCVTMLEILRKLSRASEQLQHNVIFLFNGAEEAPLLAAHGFITKHKWAKESAVFINLEAAGAGGKEILFQAGPSRPWLLKYYGQVPYPNGQAAGEELFQSGLIPSDTDFRIFRDFGNMIGMDFAFARNGYRYHTKFDDHSNIPLGSYQHVGDNTLALIRALANAPELSNPQDQPEGNMVFYDFLGLTFISYTETVAFILNIVVSIASLAIALKSFCDFGLGWSSQTLKYLSLNVCFIFVGWITAAICVVIIAFSIDALKFSLSWYGNPWIVLGLYVVPTVTCCCRLLLVLNNFQDKNNLSVSAQTQIQAHITRLIWTILLLIGTLLHLRFVYAILLPVLFQTLSFAAIKTMSLQHTVRKWQIVYILGTIVPNIFLMQQAIQVAAVLIPICGRMGSDRNPEMYVGILILILTIAVTSCYVPLITLLRQPTVIITCLIVTFIVSLAIIFTPLGFPYNGNVNSPAPQRYWIFHTSRVFRNDSNFIYKKDSGFFILNLDRNSPDSVKKYIKDFKKLKSVASDCEQSLFCGLPLATTRVIPILHKSDWIPAEQPIIHEPINLKLNLKTAISDSVTRFNFTATGPSHLTIYVSARSNVSLIGTNLMPELPPDPVIWNGRPTYVILYAWGKENTPLTFSLDFKTVANWDRPSFDIAVAGKYMNDRTNIKTPHYLQFLQEFPDWADVVAFLATYGSWVF